MFISLLGGGERTLLQSSAWKHTLLQFNCLKYVPCCQPEEFEVACGHLISIWVYLLSFL